MKSFVHFCGFDHELLRGYDIDWVSLIVCINYMMRNLFKRPNMTMRTSEYKGLMLGSGETIDIETDMAFIEFLELHLSKGIDDLKLEKDLLPLASSPPLEYMVLHSQQCPVGRNLFSTSNRSSQDQQGPQTHPQPTGPESSCDDFLSSLLFFVLHFFKCLWFLSRYKICYLT